MHKSFIMQKCVSQCSSSAIKKRISATRDEKWMCWRQLYTTKSVPVKSWKALWGTRVILKNNLTSLVLSQLDRDIPFYNHRGTRILAFFLKKWLKTINNLSKDFIFNILSIYLSTFCCSYSPNKKFEVDSHFLQCWSLCRQTTNSNQLTNKLINHKNKGCII